jgi:GT2 family glycosyltransferase
MDLSVIIVNYNVKEFLQNLIYSIQKAACNLDYEILIVDNNSEDGSVEFIREKFPFITLIANDTNLGFSKANNIGLSRAKGEYILLLNPDVIVSEDTFQKMIDFFKSHRDCGLAGCKILNPDGTLQLACRRSFPGPWIAFCKVTGLSTLFPKSRLFARYNLTYLNENETYEVDAVSGSFMMMTREAYQRVGGLDEEFFMYGEDLDLCYRIQKAGLKVFYVHSTQIIHYKGESTKRSSLDETWFFYNAMHLFVKKHLSSSFLVEIILRSAIWFRNIFAFLGRRKFILLYSFLDIISFDITLYAASAVYKSFTTWRGFNEPDLIIIYTVPALLQIAVSASLGSYNKSRLSVLKNFGGIAVGFFVLSSFTFFFKQYAYSRAVIIITYFLLLFTLSFWRIVLKLFFKIGSIDQVSAKRTLIVGINKPAIQIAEKLNSRRTDYHHINGLIGLSQADMGKVINGFQVVGSIHNLKKVIRERKVSEIIFSPEEIPYNKMMSIVAECQNENIEFKIIGNSLDFLVGKASVTLLDDMSLFDVQYNISNPVFKFIKKFFDIILSVAVLFFVYPFIYLSDRLGKRKTDFKEFILKVPLILSGKASFVGPKETNNINNLYLGKKGLTGYWYIENSEGGDTEKLNILYAKNQNIWLDLEILGKTLNKMWGKRV